MLLCKNAPQENFKISICPFKACVCYFDQFLFFSPNDSPSKTMKSVFHFISHCFTGWFKINHKVYDIINCLNKNLITHFVWYLGKEKRYDTETLSIDRVLNKTFLWKNYAENIHQKLVPDPILILVNNPKQSMHAGNSFKNKIFWKKIIKKP